ncbi:restriction endonuclease subunit S [Acinetobacter pseudolwoffii]|uniref:restriction endonuclease subunit S n=1 Tax=Acinetobacter pseudolwoffii TaxID=2053287 RepID=UPI0021E3CAF0|nr:restriction endonuclease subunit S [Acinetobacter pseudolwoffii]
MAKYEKYAEYKESGVEWLGEIPSHWTVTRLKFLAKIKNGQDYKHVEAECGFPVMGSGGQFTFSTQFMFDKPSVLLGRKGTIDKPLYINEPFWTVDTMYYTDVQKDIDVKYFYYLAKTILFDRYSTNTALPSMTQENLNNFEFAIPSEFEERKNIRKFLDHETAKIDTLIAKQEKLIELLKEKRQAVISHAVTKGLNPDVAMKNSAVEWLGQVPEHWEISPIKFILENKDYKRIPLSAEERGNFSGDYRYYGASGVIDYIDDYIFDEPNVLVGEDGANLVNRNTPLAFPAYGKYWVNNHAHILHPQDGLADYWAELIEIIDISPLVSGSAQPKLTAEALKNLKISFPSDMEERKAIDAFIKQQKAKFDLLISKATDQIKLLKERRTALISSAVTGKIDVHNWQHPNEAKTEFSA